jgi:hypothetical protein
MSENEIKNTTEETAQTSSDVEEKTETKQTTNTSVKDTSKEMPVKTRKIIGVIIMVIGVAMIFLMKDLAGGDLAGVMILFAGMWAYNPEIKDNSGSTIVPTWLGTLLIIAVVALIAWLYASFVA